MCDEESSYLVDLSALTWLIVLEVMQIETSNALMLCICCFRGDNLDRCCVLFWMINVKVRNQSGLICFQTHGYGGVDVDAAKGSNPMCINQYDDLSMWTIAVLTTTCITLPVVNSNKTAFTLIVRTFVYNMNNKGHKFCHSISTLNNVKFYWDFVNKKIDISYPTHS